MPTGVYQRPSLADRFWQKVARRAADACWLWVATKDPSGYGQIRMPGPGKTGRIIGAHRLSYEIAHGTPIPQGYVIDHLCRNPSCVNPAHLEAVPMAENTRRGLHAEVLKAKAKRQTHCKRGHPLFGPNLRLTDHGRACLACQRLMSDAWRVANRARVNERQQARRAAEKARRLEEAA